MTISVCVGSSCYLKGSTEVIAKLEQLLQDHGLADQVDLKGEFCMGKCAEGVNLKINGESMQGVTPPTVERIFHKYVLKGRENNGHSVD